MKTVKTAKTEYFVNNIKCDKDQIYNAVINNKLYNEIVFLKKKYSIGMDYNSVSFNINLKPFSKDYDSRKIKKLITKMISCVDKFHQAEEDYYKYQKIVRLALDDCYQFYYDKFIDQDNFFNKIYTQIQIKITIAVLDLTLLRYSLGLENIDDTPIPDLYLDTPEIKEIYNTNWSDHKKKESLEIFSMSILKRIELINQSWLAHPQLQNQTTQAVFQNKFDTMKTFLEHILYIIKKENSAINSIKPHGISKLLNMMHFRNSEKKLEFKTGNLSLKLN